MDSRTGRLTEVFRSEIHDGRGRISHFGAGFEGSDKGHCGPIRSFAPVISFLARIVPGTFHSTGKLLRIRALLTRGWLDG